MKRYRSPSREYKAKSKFTSAQKRLAKLQKQLDYFDLRHGVNLSTDCVAAFVVFNSEDSKRHCMSDYAGSEGWWKLVTQV